MKNNETTVIEHIKENAKQKNIYIDFIHGDTAHLHCLLSLNQDQSTSKVMQLIKGEASHWINKNKIPNNKFEWADECFAVSVNIRAKDRGLYSLIISAINGGVSHFFTAIIKLKILAMNHRMYAFFR